jgi:hypothetical protein
MTKFDDPKYDDENKQAKAELVAMMQKVFRWEMVLMVDAGAWTATKGDHVGIGARDGVGC